MSSYQPIRPNGQVGRPGYRFNTLAGAYNGPQRIGGATFDVTFSGGTIAPSKGAQGTYTRATTATIDDWEGRLRTVVASEARFRGLRRVRNWIPTTSEDFSNAAWSKTTTTVTAGVTDPNGGNTAYTLTATGASSSISITAGSAHVSGDTGVGAIWIRRRTGVGTIQMRSGPAAYTTITPTSSWQRMAVSGTLTDANLRYGILIATSGDEVDVWRAQAENVTGQSNTNPAEYVSVGVLTAAPYHGANVDGVKWFPNQNGNTVASNVVTEATGATIATAIRRGYRAEGQRVNRILQSEDMGTTWADIGTPTRVAANVRCGDVVLDLIGDDSAVAVEGKTQAITFSGDGVKVISVLVEEDTSVSSVIRLNDATAVADRLLVAITWSGGVPSLAFTTGSQEKASEALANGCYRIFMVTTSVTAANANNIECYPATDSILSVLATGNVNIGGWQGEDAIFSSSYNKTTTAVVTRNTDAMASTTSAGISTACTLMCEWEQSMVNTGAVRAGLCIDDGTANNRITVPQISAAGLIQGIVVAGGATQANIGSTSLTANTRYKQAYSAQQDDYRCALNGAAYGTPDTAGTYPGVPTTVRIGATAVGSIFYGDIARASIQPRISSDSSMNLLTA